MRQRLLRLPLQSSMRAKSYFQPTTQQKLKAMAESVLNHSGARAILDLGGGESELPIFWEENDLTMKGKIDRVQSVGSYRRKDQQKTLV